MSDEELKLQLLALTQGDLHWAETLFAWVRSRPAEVKEIAAAAPLRGDDKL